MKMSLICRALVSVAMLVGCWQAHAQTDRNCLRNGNKLYRQQKFAAAETEYRKALGKNPQNTQAMYNLGCALLMQQKDSAAVAQFEKAGKMETAKKRKALAYHNLGVVCQNHQMYAQAVEAYKESLRNNPADDQTRYNLALCKRQMKNQKDQNNKNDQNKKQQKQDKDNGQQQKQKEQQDKQKQQQSKQNADEKMSKENAEQLLNAALQEEKATQQRMKQQQQSAQSRKLQKNW